MVVRPRLRVVLLALVVALCGWLAFRTTLERQAIAAQNTAPADVRTAVEYLDRPRLMDDVRALSAPEMEGRRTSTDGGRRARAYIAEAFKAAGLEPFEGAYMHPFSFTHTSLKGLVTDVPFRTTYTDAANVIGRLPGEERAERWIVVSAHYDHLGVRDGQIYPGADDNASGVAVLMELARYLAAHQERHPFVFAAFDAEELGLQGAAEFVDSRHLTSATVAIDVNLDMLSRSGRREIFAAGPSAYPWLRPLLDQVQQRSAVRILFGHDRPLYQAGWVDDWTHSSDHGVFADAGIPFLYFGVEDHPDYHRPTDTADRIDPSFFGAVADMVTDTVLLLDRTLD